MEILKRAQEMISSGYELGQIEYGTTWEKVMEKGPYSDMYEAAEVLSGEFGVSIELSVIVLKKAFNESGLSITEDYLRECLEDIDIDDVESVLEEKGATDISYCDESIDDGIDGGEDQYLMLRSYDFVFGKYEIHGKFYFGDCSRTISCVEFDIKDRSKSTFIVSLTKEQLELLSDICHGYKDSYRGCEESVRPVMELEADLYAQTAGEYEPDTTYDIA